MNLKVLALFLCASVVHAAPPSSSVSFREKLVPVLKSKCSICHLTGQEAGKLALHPDAAYKSLVGVQSTGSEKLLVRPGKPDDRVSKTS